MSLFVLSINIVSRYDRLRGVTVRCYASNYSRAPLLSPRGNRLFLPRATRQLLLSLATNGIAALGHAICSHVASGKSAVFTLRDF